MSWELGSSGWLVYESGFDRLDIYRWGFLLRGEALGDEAQPKLLTHPIFSSQLIELLYQ